MLKTLTINAITQYIDDNLENAPIDIDILVNYSGYSRRYLQLLFKENIGIPVGKYIQLRRVTRAAMLLRLTTLNIIDISERLFYDSQQTFTREFRKKTGYTPLQYRKNEVWSFKHMTGYKDVGSSIPVPDVRHLERRAFRGVKIFYNEPIPSINPSSEYKWRTAESFLLETKGPVYISHKFVGRQDKESICINAVFWDADASHTSEDELAEGYYACFSFEGSIDEYRKFMYNIYMSSLPFYDLHKRDSYDLEIITKAGEGSYKFEYYLPITRRD